MMLQCYQSLALKTSNLVNPNNSFLNSGNFQLYKLVVAMMFSFPTAPIMILMGGFVGKLAFNPEFSTLPIALVVPTVSIMIDEKNW